MVAVVGRLGIFEVRPWSLQLSGDAMDPTILASKRVLGIGDPILLQRRADNLSRPPAPPTPPSPARTGTPHRGW